MEHMDLKREEQTVLRSIIARAFGRASKVDDAGGGQGNNGLPEAGEVFRFRTRPYNHFSVPETGRFAMCKVLGADERFVAIAVLEGVWIQPPTLKDALGSPILREHRFAHTGRLAAFGINSEWWRPSDLLEAVPLGKAQLSGEERDFARRVASLGTGVPYATLHFATTLPKVNGAGDLTRTRLKLKLRRQERRQMPSERPVRSVTPLV
jgi:hypothetical protein